MMPPDERAFVHPFSYLHDAFVANPSGLAISTIGTDLTYTEVHDTALRIARVLREHGVRPGHVVGVAAQPVIVAHARPASFTESESRGYPPRLFA
jgi:acyl-CoA synthetase (AMP-forming)/AMP-acid ligase II